MFNDNLWSQSQLTNASKIGMNNYYYSTGTTTTTFIQYEPSHQVKADNHDDGQVPQH